MVIPKSVISAAERVADNAVAAVIDAIQAAGDKVRGNPVWWAAYESTILQSMPVWRRRVAWLHKRRLRIARAAIKANAALHEACCRKGVPGVH